MTGLAGLMATLSSVNQPINQSIKRPPLPPCPRKLQQLRPFPPTLLAPRLSQGDMLTRDANVSETGVTDEGRWQGGWLGSVHLVWGNELTRDQWLHASRESDTRQPALGPGEPLQISLFLIAHVVIWLGIHGVGAIAACWIQCATPAPPSSGRPAATTALVHSHAPFTPPTALPKPRVLSVDAPAATTLSGRRRSGCSGWAPSSCRPAPHAPRISTRRD